MPMNAALVGKEYRTDDTFEVGREHIRRFATAIGDTNPICHDAAAARVAGHPDIVAPPTFLTVLAARFVSMSPTRDPELGINLRRIVHGEQSFTLHRPVHAGDHLSLTSRITEIAEVGANERLTTEMVATAADGSAVATIISTLISRGTAAASES
jgi:acyl dehydratase